MGHGSSIVACFTCVLSSPVSSSTQGAFCFLPDRVTCSSSPIKLWKLALKGHESHETVVSLLSGVCSMLPHIEQNGHVDIAPISDHTSCEISAEVVQVLCLTCRDRERDSNQINNKLIHSIKSIDYGQNWPKRRINLKTDLESPEVGASAQPFTISVIFLL